MNKEVTTVVATLIAVEIMPLSRATKKQCRSVATEKPPGKRSNVAGFHLHSP